MFTRQPDLTPIRLSGVVLAVTVTLLWAAGSHAQETDVGRAEALDRQVIQLYREGRYVDAIFTAREALAIREKVLGPEDPSFAKSLNNLAELYRSEGRYGDAEPLFKRSLAIYEKALGPEHLNVATSANNLAALYENQGRYDEAEPLLKRSLTIREKALGPKHPDVAFSLNDLAQLYLKQGRYAEAEPLYKRSLAIREEARGPEHPDVGIALGGLAGLYLEQGRYAEAEPLLKRSITIHEKSLGSEHPYVAKGLSTLARLYLNQGRYIEAEPLFKRSLAIDEKVLGPEHPYVATALNNLAALYKDEGHYAEAEPLHKRSLTIREKALGQEHPDVATSLNNLATLYETQGRYAEAEPLYKRSLTIREKALGPEHPDVATTLNNLATLYEDQGRYAEAEPLYKRNLAIREKVLGVAHPDVASSLNNLATLYRDQSRYAEAEPLYKRSLAIRENALGPEHPDLAASFNNLAALYHSQGRYAEAEPLYRRSLAIYEKALGPEHPGVASSLNNLAAIYDRQGHDAEAEPLLQRSLTIREKALGPEHPDVALSLNNLAVLYRKQGRSIEAYRLTGRAVDILANRIAIAGTSRSGGKTEQRQFRYLFLLHVALAYQQSKANVVSVNDSFRTAQLANASSAAEAVGGMAVRFAVGSDALAVVVRERQDLAQRWQTIDKAIVAATSKPTAQRDIAAEDALRAEFADTGAKLDALDARIATEFPAYGELSNPKPLELAETEALLAPDEAMLVYLVGGTESWLWALRSNRPEFYKLDITAQELATEVGRLRARLDPGLNPDVFPFDAKRAYDLYQKIVAPAAALLDGAHQVFLVPDGALGSLPFGVLVTMSPAVNPETVADHRDIAWLARDKALTVLPAVGTLKALRQFAKSGHAADPFVGFGDPTLEGKPHSSPGIKLTSLFRGAMADVDAVRQLPPLPETADELRAVAKTMRAGEENLYLGERATEPMLRQAELVRFQVIEFATHGLMSGDLRGLAEPALVLTPPKVASPDDDGLLTASKIATLKLNADWVVLSACNTAAADGISDAGGLSGLAKAFFYAGTRSLLVSNWGVPSKATATLVTTAFDELRRDPAIGRAEAVRRAEMAMLDPNSPAEYAHPMFWAPFIIAGEGGAGGR